jgi:hypothetical protein
MERVSLTADGTLFTHPGAGVTLTWASVTRVLTFNNNAGAFWDVSMIANDETAIAGAGTGQFALDDISGGGGTLSLDGDQAGGLSHGWYVNAADEVTGPGFTFMGTGYANYIQGIVIYWW